VKELTELLAGARAALTAPDHGIDDPLAAEILEHIDRFEAMLLRARSAERTDPDEIAWHALQLGRLLAEPMVEKYFQSVDGSSEGGKNSQKDRTEEILEFIKKKYEKGFRNTYGDGKLTDAVAAEFPPLTKGRAGKWVTRAFREGVIKKKPGP
jgi:hypothetical protein